MSGAPSRFNKANIDFLTKSLERLSIYDGHGKVHVLQISPKANFHKILGDLNIEMIEEKIRQLKDVERKAAEDGRLEDAENATNEINELIEKEILLTNLEIVEKNQSEFLEIKNINDKQIAEFNQKWDAIIINLTNASKKIEDELLDQHAKEREKLETEIKRMETPPPKFTSELLNKKVQLRHLIKSKKYGAAKVLKAEIEEMERQERESWESKYREKLARREDILLHKQKNELEAMKTKLEKSINTKLKQRMKAYAK